MTPALLAGTIVYRRIPAIAPLAGGRHGRALALTRPRSHQTSRGRRRPNRQERHVTRVQISQVRPGRFEVLLDGCGPLMLPPHLALLLSALAQPSGRVIDRRDPVVPFKTASFLVHTLGEQLRRMVSRRMLSRWVRRLRVQMNRSIPAGGELIETRRGVGSRLTLLR
jgi:hypothetical protein